MKKKFAVLPRQRYILARSLIPFAVAFFLLSFFSSAYAQFFVDGSKPAGGNGQNWTTAFNSINAAMASANVLTGAEIWVRSGTYSYVEINKSVTIYGGFSGAETTFAQRDIEANETIIDGEGSNRGVLVSSGAENSTLDGFIIQNGVAPGAVVPDFGNGGGIVIFAEGFTLTNSRVRNNTTSYATASGGGVSVEADDVVISNCIISGNSTSYSGGGIYSYSSGLIVRDSSLLGNISGGIGGGGGAYLSGFQASATIERCIIAGNKATSATGRGGGIFVGNMTLNIFSTLIQSNISERTDGGSGIEVFSGTGAQIINCTVVDNHNLAGTGGVGVKIRMLNATPAVLINSIVWANGKMRYDDPIGINDNGIQIYHDSPDLTVTYSNIQDPGYGENATGAPDGNHNMRRLPGFVDNDGADDVAGTWEDNDFRLQAGSYCIDYGNGDVAPASDMYNNPYFDDISIPDSGTGIPIYVDIGSHERQSSTPLRIHVDKNATGAGTGESWVDALTSINSAASMAIDGAEIWVRTGTYLLESQIIVDRASALYGGFNGTEAVRNQRDWLANPTVIDAQSNGYRCLNITADATVDGFTVTGGEAVGIGDLIGGGGILVKDGSPKIAHCKIENNRAINGGGIFVHNGPDTVIDSCYIINNFAVGHSECETNCGWGGGLYVSYLANYTGNGPLTTNSVISGNRAKFIAGGIFVGSNFSIMDSSIISNQGEQVGGIWGQNWEQQLTVTNSIVWSNTVYAGINGTNHQIFINDSVITYSDVQGGFTGTGNIDQSPEFVVDGFWDNSGTPADMSDDIWHQGDYHLWKNSPCIDTGIASGAPPVDIVLTARPQLSGIDMGAYEAIETVADGDVNGDGEIDLIDAILALQVLANPDPPETVDFFADINGDHKIGLAEAIYVLWKTATY